MPIRTIDKRRLYQLIAGHLRDLIEAGVFPLGTYLPGETQLSEKLGVSRNSLREALIALEVLGLVEVRGGRGALVIGPLSDASRQSTCAPGGQYGMIV